MYVLDFVKYLNEHRLIFVISALTGAGAHIFWDGFTHNNTFFTNTLPFYKGTYIPYDGVRYPLFYALQYISTGVGLAIVLAYLLALKPETIQRKFHPKVTYWLTLVTITLSIYFLRFTLVPSDYELGNAIVTCISGLSIALICGGLFNFRNTVTQQVKG